MARWVLSPVDGDGSVGNPYSPHGVLYATHWTALVPCNPDGTLFRPWCLMYVIAGDLTAAQADASLTVFPDLAYSDQLTPAQRTWLIDKCTALGQPSGWVTAGVTFGQALRTVGRWLEANFEVAWISG